MFQQALFYSVAFYSRFFSVLQHYKITATLAEKIAELSGRPGGFKLVVIEKKMGDQCLTRKQNVKSPEVYPAPLPWGLTSTGA